MSQDISGTFGRRLAELSAGHIELGSRTGAFRGFRKKYAWTKQTLGGEDASRVAGQPSESRYLSSGGPWLNNNKTFPLPNRRDTIRNGGKPLEVWPQAKTFLARF